MWVNIDDLMAELERFERKTKEEFDGEENSTFKTLLYGMLVGYSEVEMMLCKLATEEYRKQGLEHIKSLREEQK